MSRAVELTMEEIRRALQDLADEKVAEFARGYFKTGPGGYGEGDHFLGVRVPQIRRLARAGRALPLEATVQLLRSRWHEERLLALLILVDQYRRSSGPGRDSIFEVYLDNIAHINGWDLIDISAGHIVGAHLDPDHLDILETMALSDSIWQRRMAIMSTFHWIREDVYAPTLHLAEMLIEDPHDLVQKAVGWMLREVGSRDLATEEAFLRQHYRRMPRTMLRNAVEKLPAERRRAYLRGEV